MRALIVGIAIGLILVAIIVARQWSVQRGHRGNPQVARKGIQPGSGKPARDGIPSATIGKSAPADGGTWAQANDLVIQDSEFVDPKLRIRGTVPTGWYLRVASRRGQGELSLQFGSPTRAGAAMTSYFSIFGAVTPAEEEERRDPVAFKTAQRKAEGYEDYTVAPEIVTENKPGRRTLSWRATYTREKTNWKEYLTRVEADKYTMLIFLRGRETEVDDMLLAFKTLVQTTQVP